VFPTQRDSKSELKIDDLFSAIASDKKIESPAPGPVPPVAADASSVEIEVTGLDKELEPSVAQAAEISDTDMQDIISGGETGQAYDLDDDELAEFFDSSVIIDDDKDLMFELEEVDFYLDQVFLEEAKSKLAELQQKFPDSEGVKERLKKLAEMAAKSEIKQLHDEMIDLRGVFDDEPVHIEPESDLDAEIDEFFAGGKPMDAKHERSLEPIEKSAAISSASDLFSEEEDFFNITSEIEDEFSIPEPTTNLNLEAQLESIFDEFKEEINEQLSEEDYETRYNLGIAYKEMDLIDEAIHEFQSVVKSSEYVIEASSMLGYCFMEKDMAPQAIQWFSKALQNMPVNSDQEKVLGLKLTLAQAFINNNEKEKAGQMIEDISKTKPKFPGLSEIMKYL
jgi:tetratricopeptide (TPR) repeat protein